MINTKELRQLAEAANRTHFSLPAFESAVTPQTMLTLLNLLDASEEALESCETAINHAIELGYIGEGSTLGLFQEAVTEASAALEEIRRK